MGKTGGFPEEAQVEEQVGAAPGGGAGGGDDGHDGTAAVLWAMFTSFTEALGGLEQRLDAMEAAVRAGPTDLARRLDEVEAGAGRGPADEALGQLTEAVRRQSELLDQRTAALAAAVEGLRALAQAHADETSHSLGRRAGDAGRRLARDLGLRGRADPPAGR